MNETMERFHDPIYTVDRFERQRGARGEGEQITVNRFYALYSEYCWKNNYPRQTKTAVIDRIRSWGFEVVEREVNGTTDSGGNPWHVIDGLSAGRGGRQ